MENQESLPIVISFDKLREASSLMICAMMMAVLSDLCTSKEQEKKMTKMTMYVVEDALNTIFERVKSVTEDLITDAIVASLNIDPEDEINIRVIRQIARMYVC